jgi:Serine dehydrogenase proteinase
LSTTIALLDQVIFDVVHDAEEQVEAILECDVLFYYGALRTQLISHFRTAVEKLAVRPDKRKAIGLCISTPGGEAEAVEKMVEIVRHHYDHVYAIVPQAAMSAGTILCMACDKIFMDYSSSLGPIDPQVPDREQRVLVPALGYLDKVAEMIEKSRQGTISPAEFAMLQAQDLAMIRFFEQARELSISLLKQWLVRYKFKDWTTHRTTSPGSPVTEVEKEERAGQIAERLSDNNHWHSHGRMIGMQTLRDEMKLQIDDFGQNVDLRNAIRRYSDTLSDYLGRADAPFYVFNRNL